MSPLGLDILYSLFSYTLSNVGHCVKDDLLHKSVFQLEL